MITSISEVNEMSCLKDEEMTELFEKAHAAKRNGASLSKLFSVFAEGHGLAKGTIRNIYYDTVKRATEGDSLAKKYFCGFTLTSAKIVEFDEQEARSLLKKILTGLTLGKPVRRTISELTDDSRLALRYQNKYRNMLRFEKDKVKEVAEEIKSEYGRCYDPYGPKREDATLMRLKNEINDLYERIAKEVRVENQRLKERLGTLEQENARLKRLVGFPTCLPPENEFSGKYKNEPTEKCRRKKSDFLRRQEHCVLFTSVISFVSASAARVGRGRRSVFTAASAAPAIERQRYRA